MFTVSHLKFFSWDHSFPRPPTSALSWNSVTNSWPSGGESVSPRFSFFNGTSSWKAFLLGKCSENKWSLSRSFLLFLFCLLKVEERGTSFFGLLVIISRTLGHSLGLFYLWRYFVHSCLHSCSGLICVLGSAFCPTPFSNKGTKLYLLSLHFDFFLSIYIALEPQWPNLSIFLPRSQDFGKNLIGSFLGNPADALLELDLAIQVSFDMWKFY